MKDTKLNGVLQLLTTAQIFSDEDSFIIEADEKIFIGDNIAVCEIQFGKVLSETAAIKIVDAQLGSVKACW